MLATANKRLNCTSVRRLFFVCALLSLVFAIFFIMPDQAYAENENTSRVLYFEKDDAEGHVYSDCTSVNDAMNTVGSLVNKEGVVKVAVELKGDWTLGNKQCLKLPKGKTIDFNLNGHMINRNNVGSNIWSGSGWGEVFYLEEGTTLTINGGDNTTTHEGHLENTHGKSAFWRLGKGGNSQTINGGLITGGSCDDEGGAGVVSAKGDNIKVYLNDVTLAGNVSDTYLGFYGYGGAVTLYGENDRLEMSASSIKWNAGHDLGGGVYVDKKGTSIVLKKGSTIEGNYTKGKGGGIAVKNSSVSISLDDSSFISNNYAENYGGGIYLNTVVDDYTYADNTSVKLTNSSAISGNHSSSDGGGIYAEAHSFWSGIQSRGVREFTVSDNSAIADNEASGKGGGLYVKYDLESTTPSVLSPYSILTVDDNSHIDSNKAHLGGAVYCEGNAPQRISLSASTMSLNTTSGGYGDGGAIYSDVNMTMSVDWESSISENKASGFGGAIYACKDKSFDLAVGGSSCIEINSSTGEGGGLLLRGNSTIDLTEGSKIRANTASSGAGISVASDAGSCKITSSDSTGEISGNIAAGNKNNGEGAGLQIHHETSLTGLTIQSNVCSKETSSGGGIFVDNCKAYLTDCSVLNNKVAGANGGGIEAKSNDASARVVLGGTVKISGNKAEKAPHGTASDIHLAEKTGASASDVENDRNLLNNRISESTDTPLTEESRVGIQRWNYDGVYRHNVSAQSEQIAAPASVFFSDDPSWSAEKTENNVLYLKQGASSYNVSIYGASETPKVISMPYGIETNFNVKDYAKDGCNLMYWNVTGLSETTKLEPDSNGNISFKMPGNDVELHAVYYPTTSEASLVVADSSKKWGVIGQDPTCAFANSVTFNEADNTSKTFTLDKKQIASERKANVTGVTYEDVADKTGEVVQKKVTYTIEVSPYTDQACGWYVDSSGALKTTSNVTIRTVFGSAEVTDPEVSVNSEGKLVVKATATFDKPSDTTHAVAVTCKDANNQSRVVTGKAVLVENGDTYTVKAPAESGWSFYRWDEEHMPEGCTVSGDSVIVADTVTEGVEIPCFFQPVVSSASYTIPDLVVGEKFPAEATSLIFTSTEDTDVTKKERLRYHFEWTKDGHSMGRDDVVEDGATYIATVVTIMESNDDFRYVYADAVTATVNGKAPKSFEVKDHNLYITQMQYTVQVGTDTGYDGLINTFPTTYINKAYDCKNELAEYAYFHLKNGGTQKAAISWDTSAVDPAQKTGNFTVEGTFEYQGKTYEVSQKFILNTLNGPDIEPSDGTYGQKQEVTLSLDSSWDGIEDAKIYYYVQDIDKSDEPDHSQFYEYTPGEKITVGDNNSTLIAFAKNGERESESSYAFYFFDEQYSVKVDSGTAYNKDGTEISQAFEGDGVHIKADDAPEGMEFDEWVVVKGDAQIAVEGSAETSFKMPNEDVEIKATYCEKAHWTVTFNSNGGSNVSSESVIQGERAKEPSEPSKYFSIFKGWYSDEACTQKFDFNQPITQDTTLYAKWNSLIYVKFDANGGKAVERYIIESGTPLGSLPSTSLEGHTLKGWYDATDKKVTASSTFDGDTTLTAKWSTDSYLVTFMDGDNYYDFAAVDHNEPVTKPTDPQKTGYTFVGWYTDEALTTAYDFNTPVTGELTLYAKWQTNTYQVSFDTDGGSEVKSQEIEYNNPATKPVDPTREGYLFLGWYTNQEFTTLYDFDTPVTGDTTLYAKWQANIYNVEFDSNGGSEVKSQEVAYNNPVTKPADPTREGYTFKGWQLEGKDYNFSTSVTGNITLKAAWEKNDEPTPEPGPTPTPEPSPEPVNPDSGDSGSLNAANAEKDALANTGDNSALPFAFALVAASALVLAGALAVRVYSSRRSNN